MIPYLFLAVSPSLLALFLLNDKVKKQKNKKLFLLIFGLFLFCIIAFRHFSNGSSDSKVYYENWEVLSKTDFSSLDYVYKQYKFEKGYLYFVFILSKVFPNPQFAFIISALIFTFSICYFLFKNCDNLLLGATMFVCLGLFSFMIQGLRQSIAISLCLLSIEFIKKRKLIPFALIIFTAFWFHRSSLVFALAYFLYGKRANSPWLLIISSILLIGVLFGDRIISLVNDAMNRTYSSSVESGGLIAVMIYILILFFPLFVLNKEQINNKDVSFFFFATMVGLALFLIRYTKVQAAERISYYFVAAQIILLSKTTELMKNNDRKTVVSVAVILSILLFVYRLHGSDLIPYKFYWEA